MFLNKIFALLFFILLSGNACAGMTISGTRIIFPGSDNEQVVRTNNRGGEPSLVQVWIDDGKVSGDVNKIKVPFLVTPPVFRVEPGKGQSVRLIYNGMVLPQDKESLFWFNMLEIPPVQQDVKKSDRLELAFRTRIKIFYRPKTLESNSVGQMRQLKWGVINQGNKGIGIKLDNPTPYYFSFESASLKVGGRSYALDPDMVAPFSSKELYPKGNVPKGESISTIDFFLINDYGAIIDRTLKFSGQSFVMQEPKRDN